MRPPCRDAVAISVGCGFATTFDARSRLDCPPARPKGLVSWHHDAATALPCSPQWTSPRAAQRRSVLGLAAHLWLYPEAWPSGSTSRWLRPPNALASA